MEEKRWRMNYTHSVIQYLPPQWSLEHYYWPLQLWQLGIWRLYSQGTFKPPCTVVLLLCRHSELYPFSKQKWELEVLRLPIHPTLALLWVILLYPSIVLPLKWKYIPHKLMLRTKLSELWNLCISPMHSAVPIIVKELLGLWNINIPEMESEWKWRSRYNSLFAPCLQSLKALGMFGKTLHFHIPKDTTIGQLDYTVGKSACFKVCKPEFDSWDTYGKRKDTDLATCLPTATHKLWSVLTIQQINKNK